MKKLFFLMIALSLAISACGTSANPSVPAGAAINPSPISQVNLQATAAILVQQTIQAIPTATVVPSNTPVLITPTDTATITASPTLAVTATETLNPILLTLTATLGTGTPYTSGTIIPGNTSGIVQTTVIPDFSGPTIAPSYPLTYGTMPPNLPAGKVTAINQFNGQAYISVHCTSKDGYTTIVEYQMEGRGKVGLKTTAGRCYAIVWVDGKRFSASFRLSEGGNATVTITNKGVTAK